MAILTKIQRLSLNIVAWLNERLEPRNHFGMSQKEEAGILALARSSLEGYDKAVEIALSGFGMKFADIDQFFAENGIPRQ